AGGVWEETAKLTASDGGSNDQFGSFTPLDNDVALIYAIGKAYFFAGFSGTDCNDNGRPDTCDIFDGVSEDLNTNGIPDECEAVGDLNGDGIVNVRDLLALLAAWGACDEPCPPACIGDTNFDCTVNWIDLLTLLSNWG
ncbi:MAG: FG-GAP repeat protein, partial [Planctomycetota bacterium]|nr:FG-GAP repeat protein [Planctomycetota bacterium]